ncbi:UNKNOWN [Stylonychia lemnae]|uniref:Uncharacterized protein n=1 Tax=Stylonychia lemnae TaxID=5949 RepID=A0A078B959_STYLE|nr:UNKNOWN [Stylonychia lemnae]|eukprot:CDW90909.1 UNKNOWN [Stylonychia lemnae]
MIEFDPNAKFLFIAQVYNLIVDLFIPKFADSVVVLTGFSEKSSTSKNLLVYITLRKEFVTAYQIFSVSFEQTEPLYFYSRSSQSQGLKQSDRCYKDPMKSIGIQLFMQYNSTLFQVSSSSSTWNDWEFNNLLLSHLISSNHISSPVGVDIAAYILKYQQIFTDLFYSFQSEGCSKANAQSNIYQLIGILQLETSSQLIIDLIVLLFQKMSLS